MVEVYIAEIRWTRYNLLSIIRIQNQKSIIMKNLLDFWKEDEEDKFDI